MTAEHLVLAGGGHSHALLLKRWAMNPHVKPVGLITLVNRSSRLLYSGMVPGLIAGNFSLDETCIDLRALANASGVAFVVAEIAGLDVHNQLLLLDGRPPIHYHRLSLDVGSETCISTVDIGLHKDSLTMPIRPLKPLLFWLEKQDLEDSPLTVIGSGLAGLEVVMALRYRWPGRQLFLQAYKDRIRLSLRRLLSYLSIQIVQAGEAPNGPALLCTGNKAPEWILSSGLALNSSGRVITRKTFQVIGNDSIFAVGDCAVIKNAPRPASGVWAVRAAEPLARNLKRTSRGLTTRAWHPQSHALQLVGAHRNNRDLTAIAIWRGITIGPYKWIWQWKKFIDRNFIESFQQLPMMSRDSQVEELALACRGCAAKLPSEQLRKTLCEAGFPELGSEPKDAEMIGYTKQNTPLLQSMDGFPALVADPWLNGLLTTLHACSDLWARGAKVETAQAVITLPFTSLDLQGEILKQSLSGIQEALTCQGAELIGGHTLEARSVAPTPCSLGVELAICVNGRLSPGQLIWDKGGMKDGDVLLLSRAIGTGVIFAAAMQGHGTTSPFDLAISQMIVSQDRFLNQIIALQQSLQEEVVVHASTDITGFGLLGHLGEMLRASNKLLSESGENSSLRIELNVGAIPAIEGAVELLEDGFHSTLSPSNRASWELLKPQDDGYAQVELCFGEVSHGSKRHKALLELLVDPQTCGPLLISCSSKNAKLLVNEGSWTEIGICKI